jgi:two-component system sensor histidine kinase BaeS
MTHAVAPDKSHSDASTLAVWGFGIALATLGTAILFKAHLGINLGVFIACVVIALFAVSRDRLGRVSAPTLAAGLWAVVLAFGTAITTDGGRTAILVLSTFVLLAIALVTVGDSSLDVLQPLLAIQAPFVAFTFVLTGASNEASLSVRSARSPAIASLVRAMLITIPLITVLIFLLAEADPMFAAARDVLEHIVPDDFVPRSFFFGVLLVITLGAYGGVQHGQLVAHEAARPRGGSLGTLERRSLTTSLAAIMWLFVASATASLLKNPAAVAGSGVTYAEYVHGGFAELSVAATLVIGATLATRRSWITSDAWARNTALAAIAGECGMIAIAFTRVVHYEQAYGFTVLRLYAQAYMIVLACISALLLIEIVRRAPSTRFAYHSASAALLVLAGLVFWNTDAWIVRHNVDRYVESGKIDLEYLTHELSVDATPELIASLSRLKPLEQATANAWLCRASQSTAAVEPRWFEWNARGFAARTALEKWYLRTQPNCPASP